MPDHQEAQDIAQETFLRLYQEHDRFPNKPLSPGWLFSVARNLIRDAQRRSSRTIMQDPVEPPYHAHDSVATRVAVQMTLDQMDPVDQQCLWLFYYGDYSIKQIAEALDLPPGAVKTRLYRARQKFAERWGEKHG